MNNITLNRRDFLKVAGCGAAMVLTPLSLYGSNRAGSGETNRQGGAIRFGLCADVHKDVMHDADERLKVFVDRMNRERVDFIMQLGDFCRPYDYNQGFLDIFNQFQGPRYHVLGNHDMDGGFSREQTLEYWGVKDKYYSFDLRGRHFVVLDGNDKRQGAPRGYARYIGPEQLKWLKEDLSNTDLPTLIFSHQGFGPASDIENAQEIRSILEAENTESGFRKILACFNGHDHADSSILENGIYYVQVNSMSYLWLGGKFKRARYSPEIEKKYPYVSYTAPYKDSLYAMVTLRPDGTIEIEGVQSQWVPPSPSEMEIPEGKQYEYTRTAVPKISDRLLKAT